MSRKKKTILVLIGSFILLIAIGIGIFYCTFFPNPFAKTISTTKISGGAVNMTNDSNILIVYFSLTNNRLYTSESMDAVSSASLTIRDGEGYGHSELFAITAQEATGGNLFPIKIADLYPETYSDTLNRHHSEMTQNTLPELITYVENMETYDTVILIYPCWMSNLPQPMKSFLEEYDFSDKTIVPIATSQALGLGASPTQIRAVCQNSEVLDGLSARNENDIKEYLSEIGLTSAK